jgi:hypothetical protein
VEDQASNFIAMKIPVARCSEQYFWLESLSLSKASRDAFDREKDLILVALPKDQ